MAEQMTGVYDNPYKFNVKELDSETGLYYYGARYYNPRLSILKIKIQEKLLKLMMVEMT